MASELPVSHRGHRPRATTDTRIPTSRPVPVRAPLDQLHSTNPRLAAGIGIASKWCPGAESNSPSAATVAVAGFGLSAGGMLKETLDRVQDGRSLLVFPEETYGPGDSMLPFQRGGFVAAIKSGLPVLPVAVLGTRAALPPGARIIRPSTLTVRFGDPISTRNLSISRRSDLTAETRAAIERLLRDDSPASSLAS